MPLKLRTLIKIAVVASVLIGAGLAYEWGVFSELSDSKRFARAVVDMGGWGYAGFVLAYAALQPFGVPGTVFIVAAPLIWPWHTAFALSMVGTMAASVIGFSFARFVARDWVSARIPARFRRYDEALERRAFRTVFLLRLIFWMPQMLHAFLGVSRVPFWTHFWGSLLGYVAPLLLVSYMGPELFEIAAQIALRTWIVLGATLGVAVLIVALLRRGKKPSPPRPEKLGA